MNLEINLFGERWSNPLIAASGCFGFGREASLRQNLSDWGGIASKGLTLSERLGNPSPRMVETPSGMLNSVGLQNPGIDYFLTNELPLMQNYGPKIIVNVAGNEFSDYEKMCEKLEDVDITAIELNLSCPNVSSGCMSLGSNPALIEKTVELARKKTHHPLIAKLTPNTTDIAECARAAEAGGANAVSLVNTFLAMAIDLKTRRPVLKNNTGGLSGPAIKAIALRMVADVYRAVSIPVIGMGGISNGRDALEFILAGSSAVQLGMVNFYRNSAALHIGNEMIEIANELGINSVDELIGQLKYW